VLRSLVIGATKNVSHQAKPSLLRVISRAASAFQAAECACAGGGTQRSKFGTRCLARLLTHHTPTSCSVPMRNRSIFTDLHQTRGRPRNRGRERIIDTAPNYQIILGDRLETAFENSTIGTRGSERFRTILIRNSKKVIDPVGWLARDRSTQRRSGVSVRAFNA
jgi:hypothetical protein